MDYRLSRKIVARLSHVHLNTDEKQLHRTLHTGQSLGSDDASIDFRPVTEAYLSAC